MKIENCKIIFFGGVGEATGANIMLEYNQRKLLIDCGLLQGLKEKEETNFLPFKYNPEEVEFLLITHAHMDHIGKIPKLARDGFHGRIISTIATMEIARPMLLDAFKVMQSKNPNRLLYEEKDIEKIFSWWEGYRYHEKIELFADCSVEMQDAGHILGSAIIKLNCGSATFAFTGDLGNSPSPLLPDTEFITDADYIIMESVYGDRNHENRNERRSKLKRIILDGIKRNGTIVIPAFSIERTQVLLYELNNMVEDGEIPSIPVYIDSPLANTVTAIYKKHTDLFKKEVRDEIKAGDDIFNFPKLTITHSHFESVELEKISGAKIILAGSGMSEGGRVVNHEMHYLPDSKATIILPGYQGIGTLGRFLEEGVKEITPSSPPLTLRGGREEHSGFQNKIKVRAKIEKISGYSAHADSDHLLEFVEKASESNGSTSLTTRKLRKVFVIMGEPKASLFLVQRIREYLGVNAIFPEQEKIYELT